MFSVLGERLLETTFLLDSRNIRQVALSIELDWVVLFCTAWHVRRSWRSRPLRGGGEKLKCPFFIYHNLGMQEHKATGYNRPPCVLAYVHILQAKQVVHFTFLQTSRWPFWQFSQQRSLRPAQFFCSSNRLCYDALCRYPIIYDSHPFVRTAGKILKVLVQWSCDYWVTNSVPRSAFTSREATLRYKLV